MIIDIHAHTSNNELWELHTKSATIADLEALAVRYDVSTIVLMATYFPFKGTGLRNRELLKRIDGKPLFKIFGSLDVMNDFAGGLEELRQLAEQQLLAGIKLYPGYQDFHCADPKIFPLYELAEQYDLPVTFHGGELHGCCSHRDRANGRYQCAVCHIEQLQDRSRPESMRGAIETFPQVRFIVSHLANPYFAELRRLMADCPNVYTDISGQFVSGRPSEDTSEYRTVLQQEIRQFLELPDGINRLLFGTDFPIQSYADSISLVRFLGLSSDDEQKIFSGNARNLLNL
jgi:predicted TIM-barrel fold metal-dependent hydrolase